MSNPVKKIGYLDFTRKLSFAGSNLFWNTGEDLAFSWWGTILVEATLEELKHLHKSLAFKIVDNVTDTLYVVSLFCEPFNYTGVRAIAKGATPCVTSDAEVTELDLPWYHLSMTGEERNTFINNVMSVFKEHRTFVVTDLRTMECLEIKTSADLKDNS